MKTIRGAAALAALAILAGAARAAQQKSPGYDDTPVLPDGKWRVHDSKRPHPKVVTPGDAPGKPPSDAVVLFDGTDLSKWRNAKGEAPAWKVENGYMEVTPKSGGIWTREEFGDCQLHIEWATPNPPKGESQGRGNSGVFLLGQYEVQVLDSYENVTYADGQAGAIYGQWPPLVAPVKKPGEWNEQEITANGRRIAVRLNGVIILDADLDMVREPEVLKKHPGLARRSGHIAILGHGSHVEFRNLWIKELP